MKFYLSIGINSPFSDKYNFSMKKYPIGPRVMPRLKNNIYLIIYIV